MQLKLIWSETACHAPAAAFISGAGVESWLAEIDRWGIPFAELDCYVVPESMRSVAPAGLLVVFKKEAAARALDLKAPYGRVGERLFIPLHADVFPEIDAGEWPRLLSWEVQLLHPVIGLVGFNREDRLDPASLLAESPVAGTDWARANPGLPPVPPLQYIEVHRPKPEDIIDSIREDMGSRPLQDIPKEEDDEPTPLQKALDRAKKGLMKGALDALDKLPEKQGPEPNWLGRLQAWLERNLEELERRRKNEMQRLLDLFDKNSDEALKYAIPLDDNFAGRGTAPPTWKLDQHGTNFNLNRIGRGGARDTWDAGAHYNDLRNKYHKAAREAIASGDFRKAAYIYAHLLSDFHAAANALKQGGFYHEAAVLYKEHLKNLPAAAECLELGGFYQEAIEIYDELKRFEKAGDLCAQIERPEKAAGFYEKALQVTLGNADHLDGARIADEKLRQPERAEAILLQGWLGRKQAEPCLKQYFERKLAAESGKAHQYLMEIFEQNTPPDKRPVLLNVLLYLNDHYPQTEMLHTSRQIAWEIAGEAAGRGDLLPLKSLHRFLPADRLIAGDASRFIHQGKKTTAHQKPAARIQLSGSVQWLNATAYRNQFLAIGLKDGCLQLARGNWYGHVEYYAWAVPVYDNPKPVFALNPSESRFVFVRSAGRVSLPSINLPENEHFDTGLVIGSPAWLPQTDLGLWVGYDKVTALVNTNNKLELQQYSIGGKLSQSTTCAMQDGSIMPAAPAGNGFPGLMALGGRYYTFMENLLLRIGFKGTTEIQSTIWRIRQICVSDDRPRQQLVALTDNGCALIRPSFDAEIRDADFFARNFTPTAGGFLPGGKFVAVTHDAVSLFRVDEQGAGFVKNLETATERRRVAVLPTIDRNRCAVLDASGEIRMYEV